MGGAGDVERATEMLRLPAIWVAATVWLVEETMLALEPAHTVSVAAGTPEGDQLAAVAKAPLTGPLQVFVQVSPEGAVVTVMTVAGA